MVVSLLLKQFIFLYLLFLCFSQIQNHFSRSFTHFGNIMNIIHVHIQTHTHTTLVTYANTYCTTLFAHKNTHSYTYMIHTYMIHTYMIHTHSYTYMIHTYMTHTYDTHIYDTHIYIHTYMIHTYMIHTYTYTHI